MVWFLFKTFSCSNPLSFGIGDPIEAQPPWRGDGAVMPRAVHESYQAQDCDGSIDGFCYKIIRFLRVAMNQHACYYLLTDFYLLQ